MAGELIPGVNIGVDLGLVTVIVFMVFLVIVPAAMYAYYLLKKYNRLIFPGQWKISVEILEHRGPNVFGFRRMTKVAKIKMNERNYWVLKDTGEWLDAPPLEYIILGSHAKFYMRERGVYVPILPTLDDQTLHWKGYLSEASKDSTLARLKANRDAFEKKNLLLQYAPIILSIVTVAMILVFILVVGGSMNNVAEKFNAAAGALGGAASACGATGGGAAAPATGTLPPV
jgi:hypothetical protein